VHEAFFVQTEAFMGPNLEPKTFVSETEALAIPAETKAFKAQDRDEPEAFVCGTICLKLLKLHDFSQ